MIHQVAIGISDVIQKTFAKGQSFYFGPLLFDRTAGIRSTHGPNARMVITDLVMIDDKCAVQLDDVGIGVAKLVPGSIATDNDVLHGKTSGRRGGDYMSIFCHLMIFEGEPAFPAACADFLSFELQGSPESSLKFRYREAG
jgi:hypothetical protein